MNRLSVYVLALGVFVTATSELVVSGVLQVIAHSFAVSVAWAGQLVTAYSLAFAIGTPVAVSLTARLGRKKVLIGALVLFVAGCLASCASPTFPLLMAARIVLGVSAGVYLVVTFGAVAKLVPPEKLGSSIGTVVLGFSSAMILGVPIGIAIAGWLNWQAIFLVLALLSLIVTVVIVRLLPEIEGDAPASFRRQLQVVGSVVIASGLLLTFFRESGNSVLFTYLTPFMQQVLHLDTVEVSGAMLAFGILGAVGSRLGGYAVDRFGAARVIAGSMIVHAAALLLLPLVAASLAGGLAAIGLVLFCMFAAGPAVQTYFVQQAPQASNLVLSLNTSIVHLGLAAGAGAGGAMIESASTVLYNPWLAGLVVLLGFAAGAVSFSSRKRPSPV